MTNSAYTYLRKELRREAGNGNTQSANDAYLLSGHRYYDISVPVRRRIAHEWLKKNEDISLKDFVYLLNALYTSDFYDEKTLASSLLGARADFRAYIKVSQLSRWLDELVGWAEIDTFCYGTFSAEEILSDWDTWERFIRKLAKDKNIQKRRASLVYLASTARHIDDKRVRELSFEIVDVLKNEKLILITKAISWVLRDMVKFHSREVGEYIKKNENSLPKIALRETRRKIETGRK